MSQLKRYVLLPQRSLSSSRSGSGASTTSFFHSLDSLGDAAAAVEEANDVEIRVLDSIHEDGAKLVEMTEEDVATIRTSQPDVIVAPVLYYELAVARRLSTRAAPSPLSASTTSAGAIEIRVVDRTTDAGVEGATIVAFTDFANRFGASATTDADGVAWLNLGSSQPFIEQLYAYPPLAGYWGAFRRDLTLSTGFTLPFDPIDFGSNDAVRRLLGAGEETVGHGVTVGVIDTGAGPHPDLVVLGDEDNGVGHGSHVAGIIAGRGVPPNGIAGISPGVTLRSYRVFSNPNGLAANFTIAKAIDQAVADGCDLINLSLKIDNPTDPSGFVIDPVVQFALEDARRLGSLPIAAAGNDNRTLVDFPARDPLCLAVSAFGTEGTFPAGAVAEGDIADPRGADTADFLAAFTNVGPELDVTGPGVGIVSTVPGGYGVMSGTSMACPAVTGVAARLVASEPAVLAMPRDAARSAAIMRTVLRSAQLRGFGGLAFEGMGMPR